MTTPNKTPKWAETLLALAKTLTKVVREVSKATILVSITLSHVGVLPPVGDKEIIGKFLEHLA